MVGLVVGGALFALSVPVLLLLVPQLTFRVTPSIVGVVGVLALGLGAVAAVLPVHRLKRIYPGEVFRP
jgi:ABC-type antimicrobial peptide transport system permease subunit